LPQAWSVMAAVGVEFALPVDDYVSRTM
jgi:hypothetical protein